MGLTIPKRFYFFCDIQSYLLTAQRGLEVVEMLDVVIPGVSEFRILEVRRVCQHLVKILQVIFGKHP